MFRQWVESLESEFKLQDLCLKSDQDPQFTAEAWVDFCTERKIRLEHSATYAHEQNAVAERKNQDISRIARSLLLTAGCEPDYWPYAYSHATLLSNILPHKHHASQTWLPPYYRLFGVHYDYRSL